MGGYSSRRGGFGLYGGLPGMAGPMGGDYGIGSGPEQLLPAGPAREFRDGTRPDEATWPDSSGPAAAGIGEADAPFRYRRRIGQYFRRIVEELGER
jgi:hypothetical protein